MNMDVSLHQMSQGSHKMVDGAHFLLSVWGTGCFLKTAVNNSSELNVNALTSGLLLSESFYITRLNNFRCE